MSEGPYQDYYPSAKIDLAIRFEEFTAEVTKDTAPKKPAKNIDGIRDPARAPLKAVTDPDAPSGVTRFLLVPATNQGHGPPQAQEASADGLTFPLKGIIPKRAELRLNGFRDADSLDLEVRWVDLPIEPELVRSCAINFYLGTLTAVEFAQGIRGATRGGIFGSQAARASEPLNVVPDTYVDERGRQRTNLRFQGWVDEWEVTRGEDEPMVRLKCVDNTRLFIKQQASTKQVIDMAKPIDEAVATYLANYPQFAGLTVEYHPLDAERTDTVPPRLGKILEKTATRPQLGPPLAKGGGTSGGEGFNVWDYLTDIVGAIGHNIRIDGTTIIIQRVRDALQGSRPEDPYEARSLPSGRYPFRTFIYGRNVISLAKKRVFTRKEPSNIEVRCYNARRKNIIVARFPAKGDDISKVTSVLPGDGKSEQKWLVIKVPSIFAESSSLKDIARDYYFALNKQEIGVKFKTRNLASFGGGNEDPDILDMKVGDAVEILVNRSRDQNTVTEDEQKLQNEGLASKLVEERGYSPEFAAAYAKARARAKTLSVYRVREMGVSWDIDEGVSFDITGHNFIETRLEQKPTAKPSPTARGNA